ncbi:hypothetical protein ACHAW6_008991, partial [Cyclotella cf. meneghiniana]
DFEFTKIDGQPTDEDLNQLTEECINAVASISTTNGGGQHGHIGMIIDKAEYILFSHNAARFVEATNPGPYPAIVDQNPVIRERQVAKHKAEQAEFETYQGVKNFLLKAIIKSIDPEWIAELKSERMGFNHRTPKELLDYLRTHGRDLNHLDLRYLLQSATATSLPSQHLMSPTSPSTSQNGNYIDAEPLKTRGTQSLISAYQGIYNRWKATKVIRPNWHILDNEAPEAFKQAICNNQCRVELMPADQHRRNAAERAIQTFKGHFISVLTGVSDNFPIHQWDELLPQTVLTLNLLRQSNVAPNISAYAHHHGSFNYNWMPPAPMGCAGQFHIKPSRRKTFGEHSSDGWYLKTSPEHYRTHVVLVKQTKAKRFTDT